MITRLIFSLRNWLQKHESQANVERVWRDEMFRDMDDHSDMSELRCVTKINDRNIMEGNVK